MPQRESPADGALHVDPGPDMDPALASLLETLQGKLRDIVSKSATFAATTTDEEGTYTSEREHARAFFLEPFAAFLVAC